MQSHKEGCQQLKVITEAHAGALCQILQFFQACNVVPRSIASQRLGARYLMVMIEIEATELAAEHFQAIVTQSSELPITVTACHVPALTASAPEHIPCPGAAERQDACVE